MEGLGFFLALPLVGKGDADPAVQKRQLPKPVSENIVLELDTLLKDLRIREEGDHGAGAIGSLQLNHLSGGVAPGKLLAHMAAVPVYVGPKPQGQGVDVYKRQLWIWNASIGRSAPARTAY